MKDIPKTKEVAWISWNNSTRSRMLSKLINANFYIFKLEKPAALRHIAGFFWTIFILTKKRPKKIVCQYSFLLLVALAGYKLLFPKTQILADCHNKALKRSVSFKLLQRPFLAIKKWSFSKADYLIITNSMLEPDAHIFSHNVITLPDPIPHFSSATTAPTKNGKVIVTAISSFAEDEPIELILSAAQNLPENYSFHVTGDHSGFNTIRHPKIKFTGFLSESEYQNLIHDSDIVVCLSTEDNILQCGIYESLSANTAVLTNNSAVNRECFGSAVEYTELDKDEIRAAIQRTYANKDKLTKRTQAFVKQYREKHNAILSNLFSSIHGSDEHECVRK